MQTIELTNDEYKSLLLLMNMGMWVATAHKTELSESDATLEAVHQKVLSKSADFDATDLVDCEEGMQVYFPSIDSDEAAHDYISAYDEQNFWEELVFRLAEKDAANELNAGEMFDSEADITEEAFEKQLDVLSKHEETWSAVLAEKGIAALEKASA